MDEIKVEKPGEAKLRKLGVDGWGTWECEPSTFDWSYETGETCYILEGKASVKTPDGEVEFGEGDLVCFPAGLDCTWTVISKVRKKYSFQ